METLYVTLSAAGVFTSLIFIIFLFRLQKGNNLANKLLGILFLFLTIRVGKATLYYYFNLNELSVYIGLAAFMGIGPMCYLYFKVVLNEIRSLKWVYYLHLLPPLVIFISGFLFRSTVLVTLQPYLYWLILLNFLVYLGICANSFFQHDLHKFKKVRKGRDRFLRHLLGAVTLIYLVYAINSVISIDIYVLGGLFYFVIVYLLIYKSLVDHSFYQKLGKENKFQYINKQSMVVEDKIAEVDKLMIEKEFYLNSNLKIDDVVQHMEITRHQLSELINNVLGQSFPVFVNQYRLDHAKKMLLKTKKNISEIAYASGFNAISTFNSHFKKMTGLTPTDFRKGRSE